MSDAAFGLSIDQDTNDLYLDASGNIGTVNNAEAVGEHVRQRLQTYAGEWYLDVTIGVPWLEDILGRKYDPALAEAVVKAEILNTEYISGITGFSISFNKATRGVNIKDITVATSFDEEVAI